MFNIKNRFTYLLIAFLLLFSKISSAQHLSIWKKKYPDSTIYNYRTSVTDASGFITMIGSITSSKDSVATDNVLLAKFDSHGCFMWATEFGGKEADAAYDIVLDKLGNIYITGITMSKSGIAVRGHQNSYKGKSDAFLAKFSKSGYLIWSTYYGGNGNDVGEKILIDSSNNIYLCGNTTSRKNISYKGFQMRYQGGTKLYGDIFLVKFNSAGKRLWATYYGTSDSEIDCKMNFDSVGRICLRTKTILNKCFNIHGYGMYSLVEQSDRDSVKFTPEGRVCIPKEDKSLLNQKKFKDGNGNSVR